MFYHFERNGHMLVLHKGCRNWHISEVLVLFKDTTRVEEHDRTEPFNDATVDSMLAYLQGVGTSMNVEIRGYESNFSLLSRFIDGLRRVRCVIFEHLYEPNLLTRVVTGSLEVLQADNVWDMSENLCGLVLKFIETTRFREFRVNTSTSPSQVITKISNLAALLENYHDVHTRWEDNVFSVKVAI